MLRTNVEKSLKGVVDDIAEDVDVLCVTFTAKHLLEGMQLLRDEAGLRFDTLIDVCSVDYLEYGSANWETTQATGSGFSRGQTTDMHAVVKWSKQRFGVIYHLLSTELNQRVRVVVYVHEAESVPSVVPLWPAANWFEREVYDLMGITFDNHPDLRRILTDYGFVGHPFRKDFPLIGEVEMRYDANTERCVYEPVSIQPRVTVPKVIRYTEKHNTFEAAPFEKTSIEGLAE